MLYWRWILAAVLLLGMVVMPVAYIGTQVLGADSPQWAHIADHLLWGYVEGSLRLMAGVCLLSACLAIPAAWYTTAFDFPGKKVFEWLLVLPLAMPGYIVAYTYAAMCSYGGVLAESWVWLTGAPLGWEIRSMTGAVLVLGAVLYPYTYLTVKTTFAAQSVTLLEAARTMGLSPFRTFWRVALPLARPAIAGSLFLVLMEVLNEYGTVKYFGLQTFTTGIFRAWFSMNDLPVAARLSGLLLLFIFGLILLERQLRLGKSYAAALKSQKPLEAVPLRAAFWPLAWLICGVPAALGFVIPACQLGWWMCRTVSDMLGRGFGTWLTNTLVMAGAAAGCTLLAALLLAYVARLLLHSRLRHLTQAAVLGYTVPGAVIAIGLMATLTSIDRLWQAIWHSPGQRPTLLLAGSAIGLIWAYTIRFLAVAFNPLEAGMSQKALRTDEAARLLGLSAWQTLLRIHLPMLRPTIGAAFILVFVEIMKELPLTLILRPFNFDTLATITYELADKEMLPEMATPALVIVLAGAWPVWWLLHQTKNR